MSGRKQLWGKRFGELVAIKAVGRSRRGVEWLCCCDCGNTCIRFAGYLVWAKREGIVSCCDECLRELRGGSYHYHVWPWRRLRWLELWKAKRTLYSAEAERGLTAAVRSLVAREMGFLPADEVRLPAEAVSWEPPPQSLEDRAANPEMTLEEIGQELGISRERVRQIEANALRKIRDLYRVRVVDPVPVPQSQGAPRITKRLRALRLTPEQVRQAHERHAAWQAEKERERRLREEHEREKREREEARERERERRARELRERRARARGVWVSLFG